MASRETTRGRQEGSLAQYASVAGVGLNFGNLTHTHTHPVIYFRHTKIYSVW